jgi:hypothetical protein
MGYPQRRSSYSAELQCCLRLACTARTRAWCWRRCGCCSWQTSDNDGIISLSWIIIFNLLSSYRSSAVFRNGARLPEESPEGTQDRTRQGQKAHSDLLVREKVLFGIILVERRWRRLKYQEVYLWA